MMRQLREASEPDKFTVQVQLNSICDEGSACCKHNHLVYLNTVTPSPLTLSFVHAYDSKKSDFFYKRCKSCVFPLQNTFFITVTS